MKVDKHKTVGLLVSTFMGLSISLVLSIVGPASSGHFAVKTVLVSFFCSSIISVIISILIPIKRISDAACNGVHLKNESLAGRLFSTFVSDLCFTPIISTLMVLMSYISAKRHNPHFNVPFGRMLTSNLIISFIVAYFIIFIFLPLFVKLSITIVKSMSASDEEQEENR